MYAVAFLASCAIVGRKEGPKLLCAAFVAGCAVASLGGMWEYVTQPDPAWRVMFHWENPNALAGVLVLGLFAALGLGFSSPRTISIIYLFAGGIIGSALLLTQSKGGLAGAFVGGLALFMFLGAYVRSNIGLKVGYLVAPFVLAVVLFVGLTKVQKSATAAPSPDPATPPPPSGGPAPLGRVLNPMSTAEQSASFRFNLWKGCVALIKENPIGYGIGTYRFQSARPGNTSETKLAHNSFLQLAVEAGPVVRL